MQVSSSNEIIPTDDRLRATVCSESAVISKDLPATGKNLSIITTSRTGGSDESLQNSNAFVVHNFFPQKNSVNLYRTSVPEDTTKGTTKGIPYGDSKYIIQKHGL